MLRRVFACAARVLVVVASQPVTAAAQTVEIVPFGGYRFGGDLFEIAANRSLDLDGAPVVGGAVTVDLGEGLWFEALFTHQEAHVTLPGDGFSQPIDERVVVDQWLAGGRQEFHAGRARPFLTGLVGFTRYGAGADHEIRFAVGAGGGVKLPLQRRLGVRFDSRVFTTFVDVDAHGTACVSGGCLVNLHVNAVWQMEFTADVVVVF
jgi:hypothetical protein